MPALILPARVGTTQRPLLRHPPTPPRSAQHPLLSQALNTAAAQRLPPLHTQGDEPSPAPAGSGIGDDDRQANRIVVRRRKQLSVDRGAHDSLLSHGSAQGSTSGAAGTSVSSASRQDASDRNDSSISSSDDHQDFDDDDDRLSTHSAESVASYPVQTRIEYIAQLSPSKRPPLVSEVAPPAPQSPTRSRSHLRTLVWVGLLAVAGLAAAAAAAARLHLRSPKLSALFYAVQDRLVDARSFSDSVSVAASLVPALLALVASLSCFMLSWGFTRLDTHPTTAQPPASSEPAAGLQTPRRRGPIAASTGGLPLEDNEPLPSAMRWTFSEIMALVNAVLVFALVYAWMVA